MDPNKVIEIRNLSKSYTLRIPEPHDLLRLLTLRRKRYETLKVLDGLNLSVGYGEILGLVGVNGCGKSTLQKIIANVLQPDEGYVETVGNVACILELGMGFQDEMTGRENIYLRNELYLIPASETEKSIDRIIHYADIGDWIDKPVKFYSSGMKSRLSFAIMVNVEADVYILDEALSTGDHKFLTKASQHILNLVNKGKTIIFTSHNMRAVETLCTRAIWLDKGRIRMDGDPKTVCAEFKRDAKSGVETVYNMALDGSSEYEYLYAGMIRSGKVQGSFDEYIDWLSKSASGGYRPALCAYGDALIRRNREGDAESAKDAFMKAADNGDYEGKRKYSLMSSDKKTQLEELKGFFKEQAMLGDPTDMFNYAELLSRTALEAGDYTEALELYSAVADMGHPVAAHRVANLYRDGKGVLASVEKYVEYLSLAAELGDLKSAAELGDAYCEGTRLKRDVQKAFEWYLVAASHGHEESQFKVATMYRDGIGVEQSTEEADRWLHAHASSAIAKFEMLAADMIRSGAETTSDLTPGILYGRAADSLNWKPRMRIASNGLKDPSRANDSLKEIDDIASFNPRSFADAAKAHADCSDMKGAFDYYSRGAVMGDPDAIYQVAQMYKNGEGVDADETQYRKYTKAAARKGNRDARFVVNKWNKRNNRRKKPKKVETENDEE